MEIKKHLSFLFICITTYILPANAQKLVSTNNLWAYLNRNPFTGEDITTYYKLGADTTLGVNTFKKLFYCNDSLQNQWYYSGTALRE
ncbi:MAG: hypothetical protein IT237_03940, partial [Bacteroidia bacterium]|nr:hypothetical protein [Bacteroidia bacterium]